MRHTAKYRLLWIYLILSNLGLYRLCLFYWHYMYWWLLLTLISKVIVVFGKWLDWYMIFSHTLKQYCLHGWVNMRLLVPIIVIFFMLWRLSHAFISQILWLVLVIIIERLILPLKILFVSQHVWEINLVIFDRLLRGRLENFFVT